MENEVPVANIQMSGKVSTLWSQVNCHKHREEATPFIVFGKLSKWESSVRKQIFNVYELSQESFLLPNLRLCSLTCEMYSTRQWCCSTHRDEGKFFFFPLACIGSFLLCGLLSVWDNRGLLPSCGKHGFSLWWFLLLWSTGPRHKGLSRFTTQAQYLWLINLVSVTSEIFPEQESNPCLLHY